MLSRKEDDMNTGFPIQSALLVKSALCFGQYNDMEHGVWPGVGKMITLPKVLRSLQEEVFEVKVPVQTALRAKKSIDRMLEIAA